MANSEEIMISTDQDMFVMEDDDDDNNNHPHSLSRLSMCHGLQDDDDDDDASNNNGGGGGGGGGAMTTYMSKLSIESFDGDADEEFSDENKERKQQHFLGGLSSDSDKELGMADCYSLPGTPRIGQRRNPLMAVGMFKEKEYASENEVVVQKGGVLRKKMSRKYRTSRRRMMMTKDRWVEKKSKLDDDDDDDDGIAMRSSICCYNSMPNNSALHYNSCGGGGGGGFSGESDQGGAGLVVITRPKGGRRSLCMDMEEVKACNDLGFELEHERMLDMPSGISLSASTLDTSSGGNSPIGSWRISSPGDNPRDVKARLKVWAQAVAIASSR